MNETFRKEFTHLKIHTQYSICEGALRTKDLGKYCKENKIKAVEAGAHGTLEYTIKEGTNKNKIADQKILKKTD